MAVQSLDSRPREAGISKIILGNNFVIKDRRVPQRVTRSDAINGVGGRGNFGLAAVPPAGSSLSVYRGAVLQIFEIIERRQNRNRVYINPASPMNRDGEREKQKGYLSSLCPVFPSSFPRTTLNPIHYSESSEFL